MQKVIKFILIKIESDGDEFLGHKLKFSENSRKINKF